MNFLSFAALLKGTFYLKKEFTPRTWGDVGKFFHLSTWGSPVYHLSLAFTVYSSITWKQHCEFCLMKEHNTEDKNMVLLLIIVVLHDIVSMLYLNINANDKNLPKSFLQDKLGSIMLYLETNPIMFIL